jgi:hypothetical protein
MDQVLQALGASEGRLVSLVVGLALGVVLGAVLAFVPGRLLPGRKLRVELAQAIMLIGGASAMAIVVIGDSTARAFGLVGLGAFVRFRTPLRDPRDAAAMFMAIGLGMAAGIQEYGLGILACVLFTVLLAVLGARVRDLQVVMLRADCPDPAAALPRAREAVEKKKARVIYQEADRERGRVKLRVETHDAPEALRQALEQAVPEATAYRLEIEG